jgi:hypothetical protein
MLVQVVVKNRLASLDSPQAIKFEPCGKDYPASDQLICRMFPINGKRDLPPTVNPFNRTFVTKVKISAFLLEGKP